MSAKTFFKRRSSRHNKHHVFERRPHTQACPHRCAPHSAVRMSTRTRALGPAQQRHDCSTSPTRLCQAAQVSTVASEHRRTHTAHRPAGKSRTYPDRPPHFVHFWGVKRQNNRKSPTSYRNQRAGGMAAPHTASHGRCCLGARVRAPGRRLPGGRHRHTALRPQARAALQAGWPHVLNK